MQLHSDQGFQYTSQAYFNLGQQLHKYKNLLNREFRADGPNSKWVTDISYIHTKQGVLYLSMIRDLYDNSIVAYKTGTKQTVNLVLDTIRLAMKQEKKRVAAELQLHSDQGFQYTSQAYFQLTKQYGITPSMSRKGNPYDNAMAENFFSILKTECIYRHKPETFSEANEMIDRYIYFYNRALHCLCQGKEIHMTTPWRKTSSPFSKKSVFTGTNQRPLLKQTK